MKPSFLAVIILLAVSAAQAQTPFFQGKTIRIVTGYPAGDVNDLWPRLIARHMGKYMPGNPSFIVQNMPGASSMIAANYVYGVYELMDQYKTVDQSRRVATVILAGGVFGRPLVGPAGIPPEIVKTLRAGVASALKDPELKIEAEKRNYELDPVGGEEMQRLAKEVMSQPPAVLERMKKVLGE